MGHIKFIVNGMTCGHCKAAVEKALGQLKGVSSVHVDLQSKEVSVQFDQAKVDHAAIKETIEDMGYDVEGI